MQTAPRLPAGRSPQAPEAVPGAFPGASAREPGPGAPRLPPAVPGRGNSLNTEGGYRRMRDEAGGRPSGTTSWTSRVCMPEGVGLHHKPKIQLRYTRECATLRGTQRWRIMISAERRALMNSDVRCYECSVRRDVRMSVPFSGTAVKHGKLPVSFIHQRRKVKDLTPVDPAGGHRCRNSIKTCESRVFGTRRTAQ